MYLICMLFYSRCSSGTTESFKEKHVALRSKKAHLVSIVSSTVDDKSSSESLNFGNNNFLFCLYIHNT